MDSRDTCPCDKGFQPVPLAVREKTRALFQKYRPARIPIYLFLSLPVLLQTLGCHPCPPGSDSLAFRRNPALRPVAEVIAAINANNQKIPTLWATLNYSATIHFEGQTHSLVSDDGMLLFMRPDRFRLIGRKEFVGDVFDLGANGREFWLKLIPGAKIMEVGTFADLAHSTGANIKMPVRPDLVAEVLAVGTFSADLLKPPVPVMRYDGATDSYVFVFALQGDYHWFPQREVWYDRATLRPRRIVIYDFEGQPKLDARLTSDKPVESPGIPQSQWPVVAGDFKLYFPDDGSHMEFTLKDIRLYKEVGRNGKVPNASNFELPDASDVRVEKVTGSKGE
jgi:hypothetical protein